MLFEELVLHNFGIYQGRHVINLKPKSPNKPIILFGALNGGGKTTFLDALQLVLYGKFASCSNRGTLSYTDYLARTINSHVDPKEGAGLELQFTHVSEGREQCFRVIRTWRSTGKGMKERLEVLCDGEVDPVVTDRWYEYVEEFIPSQISSLFFFDGEKIEALADKSSSAKLLRTGIHALLGLDLVDQLGKDLIVVEGRRRAELVTSDEQSKIEELQKAIEALESKHQRLTNEIGEAQIKLDRASRKESETRAEFRREGGELLEQREAFEAERKVTEARLKDAEGKLLEYAAGAAPLLLLRPMLSEVANQAHLEHKAMLRREFRDEIAARDAKLVTALAAAGFGQDVADVILAFQSAESVSERGSVACEPYLNVAPDAFAAVSDEQLDKLAQTVRAQVAHTEAISDTLHGIVRKIASIPDPEALSGITERLERVISDRDERRIKIEALRIEKEKADKELEARRAELLRHLERETNQDFVDANNRRVLAQSRKVRETLGHFRKAIAVQHIGKLESLITESFKQLVRKSTLLERIQIDVDTFSPILFKANGEELSPERLSAGERQLLAVSILWGLAKASGRPLPTIVDTPLGRLDGEHRRNLVSSYFPYASHQVILLSTDEEIDDEYHKKLEPALSRQYLISYNEQLQTSQVSKGYFWTN